jgi:hypothetical protein
MMPLWEFTPAAAFEDARWLDHRIWERVIVAAPSAGEAIRLAAKLEEKTAPEGVGNESVPFVSGFEDEKLYRLRRLPDEEVENYDVTGGEPHVVDARIRDE